MNGIARLIVASAIICCCSSAASARTWTNDKGEQIDAEIVSVSGTVAVLNKGGEAIKAPIDRLCAVDQEYLKKYKEVRRFREWKTTDGESRRARYVAMRNDRVVLKVGGREEFFSIDDFVDEDRAMIEDLESLAAVEAPSRRHVGKAPEPEMRTWTNKAGKEIEAEYRRLEGDKVVLWFKDREWRFSRDDLSAIDQDYIDAMENPVIVAPPPTALAQAGNPAFGGGGGFNPPTPRFNVPSRMNDPLADMRARTAARTEQMRLDAQRRAEESAQRHQDMMRKQQERFASMNTPTTPRVPSVPRIQTPSIPSRINNPTPSIPRRPTSPITQPRAPFNPRQGMVEVIRCGKCGHEHLASGFKAGDRCKGCGVTIGKIKDRHGKVVDEASFWDGKSSAQKRGIMKGIAAIVVFGGSALAFLGRKLSGG